MTKACAGARTVSDALSSVHGCRGELWQREQAEEGSTLHAHQ